MPFWRAVLGYEPRSDSPDEDLVDPRGRGPAFWFERMGEPRPDGGGAIHMAVWVPHDRPRPGSQRRSPREAGWYATSAPTWWTLADPAGNEADIATTMNRE